MTKLEIGSLVSRILGLCVWLVALYELMQHITMMRYMAGIGMMAGIGKIAGFQGDAMPGLPTPGFWTEAAMFAVGALLFFSSQRIARLLLPPHTADAAPTLSRAAAMNATDWQTLAFSVVGLVILIFAVSQAAELLTQLVVNKRLYASPMMQDAAAVASMQIWPQVVGLAVRLVLGFVLFRWPRENANWRMRL